MPNGNYELGRIGVFGSVEELELPQAIETAQRLESLGYRTFWHGMSLRRDLLLLCSALLGRTRRLTLGTGILPILERPPSVMAAAQRTLAEQFARRFILGNALGAHRGAGARSVGPTRTRPTDPCPGIPSDFLDPMDADHA